MKNPVNSEVLRDIEGFILDFWRPGVLDRSRAPSSRASLQFALGKAYDGVTPRLHFRSWQSIICVALLIYVNIGESLSTRLSILEIPCEIKYQVY
jgi:hypothetical protein